MSSKNIVGRGEADSVSIHVGGYSDVLDDTNEYYVDLTAWIGRYVKIVFQGETIYYAAGDKADAEALDAGTPYLITGVAATTPAQGTSGTRGVADVGFAPSEVFEIPMEDAPFLFYKASSSGAQITILPK